jgi:hypothetical protein
MRIVPAWPTLTILIQPLKSLLDLLMYIG